MGEPSGRRSLAVSVQSWPLGHRFLTVRKAWVADAFRTVIFGWARSGRKPCPRHTRLRIQPPPTQLAVDVALALDRRLAPSRCRQEKPTNALVRVAKRAITSYQMTGVQLTKEQPEF